MAANLVLFELAAGYRALAERLTDLELDPQTLADTLEGESTELQIKATNVAMVARNLDGLAGQIREAEEAMAKRRKALEARAEWLRNYLLTAMQVAGVQSIESPHFAIKRRKLPGRVVVDNQASIPETFWRHYAPPPPEVDKAAIKDALKAGEDVPGAHLEQGEKVEIK